MDFNDAPKCKLLPIWWIFLVLRKNSFPFWVWTIYVFGLVCSRTRTSSIKGVNADLGVSIFSVEKEKKFEIRFWSFCSKLRLIAMLARRKANVCVKNICLSFAKKKDFSFFLIPVIMRRINKLRRKIPMKNITPRLKRRKLVKTQVNSAKLARNIGFWFRKLKDLCECRNRFGLVKWNSEQIN